jgi:4-hydroxythreonine-4-phosphate dehydrogenase
MSPDTPAATSSGTLLLTLGDPNGLGPELVCRHLQAGQAGPPAGRLLLIGPEEPLLRHCRRLGVSASWRRVDDPADMDRLPDGPGQVGLYCPPDLDGFVPAFGRPTEEGGRAAGRSLEVALGLLTSGLARGIVTAPLNKAMLQAAGFDFPGHTEFLAVGAGLRPDQVCMHLCGWGEGPLLRVSLATTHPPLRQVPDLVTVPRILRCLTLTHGLMRALGQDAPIGVCGLNPHAGESGRIGREEIEVIGPAVELARTRGLAVEGPIPGDTIFHHALAGRYSAVLAMYHDQGLAPLKLLHFGRAVNVTLGLPFVRTSVDHGTGYDLVGTGRAEVGSLAAALDMAAVLLDRDLVGQTPGIGSDMGPDMEKGA